MISQPRFGFDSAWMIARYRGPFTVLLPCFPTCFSPSMPARYRIYPDEAFVYSEAYGDLRGEDLLAHARALAADPAFSASYAQLADYRDVVEFAPSSNEMRAHAAANPFNPNAPRVALVAAPVVFGMLRMYQFLTDTGDSGSLVTTVESAAWAHVAREPSVLSQTARSIWESTAI